MTARIGKALLGLLLCLCFSALARAGTLTGELDKAEGTIDDQFLYTLSIQGNADGDPAFPKIDGIEVREAGKGQSISVVNGQYSREVQLRFVLSATKAGTYTIPAIHLKIDGKDEQTLPIEFKVGAAEAGSSRDDAVFIERNFSKTKVYVGEAIGVRIKIFNRIKILGANPDFPYPGSFQVRTIEGQKTYTQVSGGQEYNVTELQAVLIPTQEGKFTIEPATLLAKVAVGRRRPRSFFDDLLTSVDVQEKKFRSDASELEVLPLPLAGRRKDFSGLVGEFHASSSLSPSDVQTGDTVNLDLQIQGVGTTAGMAEPQLPVNSQIKVYKDKPQSEETLDANKGIVSRRNFKYALVPTQPGKIELSPLKIQVFNPEQGAYQDLTIELGSFEAKGQAIAPSVPPPRSAPKAEANEKEEPSPKAAAPVRELIGPHPLDRLQGNDRLTSFEWIAALGLGLFGIGGIGASAWKRTRRRPETLLKIKANKAFRLSKKQLEHAIHLLDRQDVQAAVQLAQSSFRTYIGDKFSVPAAGSITLRDVEGQLSRHGLDGETLYEVRDLWQGMDQMLYAPPLALNPERGRQLLQRMSLLLEKVEHRC